VTAFLPHDTPNLRPVVHHLCGRDLKGLIAESLDQALYLVLLVAILGLNQ
jgi:hypothetical protein